MGNCHARHQAVLPTDKGVLHEAYVEAMGKYTQHLTHAVTVTFKTKALISPQDFGRCKLPKNDIWTSCKRYKSEYRWDSSLDRREWRYLTEEVAENTLRYFYSRLSYLAFGKDTKRTSTKSFSKPLMITSLEGALFGKRLHGHLAIGNLPKGIDVRNTIERAWFGCDFANRQIKIKSLESTLGWLGYITKEVNLGRVDALNIQSIQEPQSYLNSLA